MKKSPTSTFLIFSLLLSLLFYNCKKDDVLANSCDCSNTTIRTCVIYEETLCLDPWGHDFENENQLRAEIEAFLNSTSIDLDRIGIEVIYEGAVCYACSCKSGRRICGMVDNRDLPAIKELGFTEL